MKKIRILVKFYYLVALFSVSFWASIAYAESNTITAPVQTSDMQKGVTENLNLNDAVTEKSSGNTSGTITEVREPLCTVFELDFEQGFRAQGEHGEIKPISPGQASLTEGIYGMGGVTDSEKKMVYNIAGDLLKQKGAIAFWFKPSLDITRKTKQRLTFFTLGSMQLYFGPRRGRSDIGNQSLLRLQVGKGRNNLFSHEPLWGWNEGDWHHIIINWDAQKGNIMANIDGVPAWFFGNRDAAFQMPSWKFSSPEKLYLGAAKETDRFLWHGVMDEVRIFNRPLTNKEAQREFLRRGCYRIRIHTIDRFVFTGENRQCRLVFDNPSSQDVTIRPSYEFRNNTGRVTSGRKEFGEIQIKKGGSATDFVNLNLPEAGEYFLGVSYKINSHKETEWLDLMAIDSSVTWDVEKSTNPSLVASVNAVTLENVVESTPSRIVTSSAGKYREAGPKFHDRFVVPFTVKNVGKPHIAVITYPDDKPRTMEVLLQRLIPPGDVGDYQAQTGLFTGEEYPLSNKMLEHRVFFWPSVKKMGFIIMTAEDGYPAAMQTLKVYELEGGLQKTTIKSFHGSVPARQIGLYYEDPVLAKNFSMPPLFPGFGKAVDALLNYMDWVGLSTLHYPIAWYRGPLYGSDVEPFGGNISGRPHPYDYPHYLLKKLQIRGMKFNGGMHIHNLPSLEPLAIIDESRVYDGQETVLNMQKDNHLIREGFHRVDPFFNPIDPNVQEAVKRIVREIVERYGDDPAFTGLTLVLPRHKLFAFGSINSGYNDINLRRFQQETGIQIPVDSTSSQRFSQAYEWLMKNARREWISWRCQKIHSYYKEMADILSSKRSDLKLIVNLFARPELYHERLADYISSENIMAETLGEAGLDPELFINDENIVLSWTAVPADYRFFRIQGPKAAFAEDHRTTYIAPEITSTLRDAHAGAWLKLHDRYFEDDIGRTNPLEDLGVKEIGWRVSTLNANTFHSIEMIVQAMNSFDALNITKGGFVIGTFGMEQELTKFAKAFRAIPAVSFDDVKDLSDPVRVRQKVVDGKLYFYVLNCLPVSVGINLKFNTFSSVIDLVEDKMIGDVDRLSLNLAPYELRSYRADIDKSIIAGGQTNLSGKFIKSLQSRIVDLDRYNKRDENIEAYLNYAHKLLKENRFSRLYFLLQESWTKKLANKEEKEYN